MLKFFRKYNKWILSVGACFLMVAFLVDPSLWSSGGGDMGGEPVGTVGETTLTVGDQRQAQAELALLRQLGLLVLVDGDEELTWVLMKHEAAALGLDAGRADVDMVLGLLGVDEARLSQLARDMRASPEFVRETIRQWVMNQQYRELMLGLAHQPLQDRLTMYMTAASLYQQAAGQPEFIRPYFYQQADVALAAAAGRPRLSEPMLQRMAIDQLATARFTALAIPAGKVLPQVTTEPDAQALESLFERFKDTLPPRGEESEGLPFGYRTPDRVHVEYLAVPLDRVTPRITIDEADALAHYEANKDRYRAPVDPEKADMLSARGELRSYVEVRTRIIEELTQERAGDLADRIIKAARSQLLDDARSLPEKEGYRDIPADWTPMPLTAVAEAVQQDAQLGVLPDVRGFGERWFDMRDLAELPGIGRSVTTGSRPIPFPVYAMSTREISPDSPAASLTRMQVGLPSAPLVDGQGTRYLFRLTAAEPARSPASLDEVREQVVSDARRVAAFELLKSQSQTWLDQARDRADWEALAQTLGVERIESGAVPRRELAGRGQPLAPMIDGIGRSEAVIDAVFDKASVLADEGKIADIPPADRLGAAASEPSLSLIVFRVEEFTPIAQSVYRNEVGSPAFTVRASAALEPREGDAPDPLSLAAIKDRIKFVSAHETP